MFLLYSPLNQGLKQEGVQTDVSWDSGFLLYSPLNQGLKQTSWSDVQRNTAGFYSTVH